MRARPDAPEGRERPPGTDPRPSACGMASAGVRGKRYDPTIPQLRNCGTLPLSSLSDESATLRGSPDERGEAELQSGRRLIRRAMTASRVLVEGPGGRAIGNQAETAADNGSGRAQCDRNGLVARPVAR